MKVKENYSSLMEEAAAKAILATFAGIVVFICGFATWSVLCMGGAIVSLLR